DEVEKEEEDDFLEKMDVDENEDDEQLDFNARLSSNDLADLFELCRAKCPVKYLSVLVYMSLRNDYGDIFESLNKWNEVDLIEDKIKLEGYEQLYSLIKTENGSIYKNNVLFDEKIFIEIFVNRIWKNVKNIPIKTLKDYFNSFGIILKTLNTDSEILILLAESYQNLIGKEMNKELIELFDQFDLLMYEKYQYLASNVETDFANLMLNVKRKNRILNITFKYLSNSLKEKNIESIGFERNELINTILAIKNTFETNKLQLQDIVNCCEQLNKVLIQTSCIVLKYLKIN
ncbi:unnamed protein product, partial [Didymodactylos carnosus]